MSFAGHVLDMIQRAKSNSALLSSKKARRRRVREAYANARIKNSLYEHDKKLNHEEWEIYKQELKIKLKKQNKSEFYMAALFLIIFIMAAGFFCWLLFY